MTLKNVMQFQTTGLSLHFTHPMNMAYEIFTKDGKWYERIYVESIEEIPNPNEPLAVTKK